MRSRSLCVLVLAAASMAACSKEPKYTEQQRSCIAQRYSSYDRKRIDQCVDVCKACMNGNTITCNTSCRLNGAS
jgi:hypothetical protein